MGVRLEAALRRFATLTRPINLNFFCYWVAEPEPAEEMRWRQTLEPYYLELGLQLPEPSTAGARRPIDATTINLLEPFRPRIVSFHFGLSSPPLLDRIKAWSAMVLASATIVDVLTLSLPKASKRAEIGPLPVPRPDAAIVDGGSCCPAFTFSDGTDRRGWRHR